MSIPLRNLNDGRTIPTLGLGTYTLRGEEGIAAITSAIGSGYRLIDSARNYENEHEVGEAVRAAATLTPAVRRNELFVTTKLPGRHHGYTETLDSFEESLANLGLDYIDLYLIHWPLPRVDKFVDSWRAFIELRERGLVRSIGVSNFTRAHLTSLVVATGIAPAVNQVEMHPLFPQTTLRAFHDAHNIATQAWSPLGSRHAAIADAPVIRDIARAKGKTPTQVVLRWHVQLGSIPIPKSADPARQRENLEVFDFELSAEEIAAITGLESGRLWGGDPETHEEF